MAVAVILDILIILFAVFALVLGLKRGLVWMFFRRFRKLSAAVIALLLAKPVGLLISRSFLADKLTHLILSTAGLTDITASSPDEMLANVPSVVRLAAQFFHYDMQATAQAAYDSGDGMYYTLISDLSAPIANGLSVVLAWFALFLVALLLMRITLRITEGFFELPVIKQVNALCGAAVSLVFHAAILWVLCKALMWISTFDAVQNLSFMRNFSIDNTYIAKYIYHFNPLAFLFSIKPNQ